MKTKLLLAPLLMATVFLAPITAPARPAMQTAPFPAFASQATLIPKTPQVERRLPPDSGTYTVVDDPNAGTGYGQGTFPYAINSSGSVAGWYTDVYGKTHGFVRASDGTYADVDVGTLGTAAYGINAKGAIGGGYVDRKTNKCPGFLRTASGHFKKFDPPDDAGTYPYDCAYIGLINKAATITGDYYDKNGLIHAFLRTADGTITEYDAPGAVQTWGFGINDSGAIAGPYRDSGGDHGYIRAADGSFTTFDAPSGPGKGNIATRINRNGETEGDFVDDNNVVHGLLRMTDGTLVQYDAPDAGTASGQGTGGEGGINRYGTAVGAYLDAGGDFHGYIRGSDGTLVEFDPPGSIWTTVWDINDGDVSTGFYIDTYAVFHGFIRTP